MVLAQVLILATLWKGLMALPPVAAPQTLLKPAWSLDLGVQYAVTRTAGEYLLVQDSAAVLVISSRSGRRVAQVELNSAEKNSDPLGLRAAMMLGSNLLLTIGRSDTIAAGSSQAIIVNPATGKILTSHRLGGRATVETKIFGKLALIATQTQTPEGLRDALYAINTSGSLVDLTSSIAKTLLPPVSAEPMLVSLGSEAYAYKEGIFERVPFEVGFFGQPDQIWVLGARMIAAHRYPNERDLYGALSGFSSTSGWVWKGTRAREPLNLMWCFSGEGALGNLQTITAGSNGSSLWAQQGQDVVRFSTTGKILRRLAGFKLLGGHNGELLFSNSSGAHLMSQSGRTALRAKARNVVAGHLTSNCIFLFEASSRHSIRITAYRR